MSSDAAAFCFKPLFSVIGIFAVENIKSFKIIIIIIIFTVGVTIVMIIMHPFVPQMQSRQLKRGPCCLKYNTI